MPTAVPTQGFEGTEHIPSPGDLKAEADKSHANGTGHEREMENLINSSED